LEKNAYDCWGEFENLKDEIESFHSEAVSEIQSEGLTPIMQDRTEQYGSQSSHEVERIESSNSEAAISKSEDYPAP
jgi:hypothetical protein